jgi:hypothetical protein
MADEEKVAAPSAQEDIRKNFNFAITVVRSLLLPFCPHMVLLGRRDVVYHCFMQEEVHVFIACLSDREK